MANAIIRYTVVFLMFLSYFIGVVLVNDALLTALLNQPERLDMPTTMVLFGLINGILLVVLAIITKTVRNLNGEE